MSTYVLWLAMLGGPVLLAIWLAKRDRSHTRHWGNQTSQNSIRVGGEIDMPRILPVEAPAGLTVNRAPVDDTSHEQVLSPTDTVRSNSYVDRGTA